MSLINSSYFQGELTIAQISQPEVAAALQIIIDDRESELLTRLLGYELNRDFRAGLLADPIDQKWLDILYGVEYTPEGGRVTKWRGLIDANATLDLGASYPADIEIIITGALIGANTYTNNFLSGKAFRVVQRMYGNLGSDVVLHDNGFTLVDPYLFEEGDRYYIEFIAPEAMLTAGESVDGVVPKSPIANYVYYHYMRDNYTFTTGSSEKKNGPQTFTVPDNKLVRAWNEMVRLNIELDAFLGTYPDVYPQYTALYPFGFDFELFRSQNTLNL